MTPFHPKLRRALLSDEEHRARGLTSRKLKEYEEIAKQLDYDEYYPPRQIEEYRISGVNIEDIARAIAEKYKTPDSFDTRLKRIMELLEKLRGEVFSDETKFLERLEKLLGTDICKTDKTLKELILKLAFPPRQVQEKDPVEQLIEFRNQFMPNYDKIVAEFVKNQQRAIEKGYYDFRPWKIIKISFLVLAGWFKKLFPEKKTGINKRPENEKSE